MDGFFGAGGYIDGYRWFLVNWNKNQRPRGAAWWILLSFAEVEIPVFSVVKSITSRSTGPCGMIRDPMGALVRVWLNHNPRWIFNGDMI